MAKSKRNQSRQPNREAFLAAYAKCGNLSAAAKLAKCGRSNHYAWLSDPEYAAQFAEAHEEACDVLEGEARRRAVDGTLKPVFYQGEKVGSVREFSDTLLIFLLKGVRPEKFRERFDHRHAGHDGGPIAMQIVEELVDGSDNDPD